jgi:hypothetical protein
VLIPIVAAILKNTIAMRVNASYLRSRWADMQRHSPMLQRFLIIRGGWVSRVCNN